MSFLAKIFRHLRTDARIDLGLDVDSISDWAAGTDSGMNRICDAGLWIAGRLTPPGKPVSKVHSEAAALRARELLASKKHPEVHRILGTTESEGRWHGNKSNYDFVVRQKDVQTYWGDAFVYGAPDIVYGTGICRYENESPIGPILSNYFDHHEIVRTGEPTRRDLFYAAIVTVVCRFPRGVLTYAVPCDGKFRFISFPIRELHRMRAQKTISDALAVVYQPEIPKGCNSCRVCTDLDRIRKMLPKTKFVSKRRRPEPTVDDLFKTRVPPATSDAAAQRVFALERKRKCLHCKVKFQESLLAYYVCKECFIKGRAKAARLKEKTVPKREFLMNEKFVRTHALIVDTLKRLST